MLQVPPSDAVSKCTYTVGDTVYKISAWTWKVRKGVSEYSINLCGLSKSTGECKNAAVCKNTDITKESGEKRNFGNYAGRSTERAADKTGFNIVFRGTKGKCVNSGSSNVNRRSKVILICGKFLGSPQLTEAVTGDNGCEVVFEFVTNEACKNSAHNTVPEIPCYLYQKNSDKKIDLTPLIKLTGSHEVASESTDYDLHINVCREITPAKNITTSHTHACPSGTSSCRILKNGKKENMGQPSFNLIPNPFNDKQIVLHYNASKAGTGCKQSPTTTIVFECPELFHQASGKGPRVTADHDCHYEVLWLTEFACSEAVLTNSSCVIKNEFVQFDLTPLKATSVLDNYKVTPPVAKGKTKYAYFINVCDSTHIPCPVAKNASVCQEVPNTKKAYNLGVTQELRYADGELTMIYKNGDRCHSSGFKRSTIISFKCEPTIDKGKPEFREEDSCLYLFDWKTKYACPPSRRTGTNCQVTSSMGVRYDLSELVRMDNMNWLAIDGQQSSSDNEIYISVCGELMNVKGKTDSCDKTNAICIVNKKTKVVRNLGKYTQQLILNSDGSMLLNYTGGDVCKTMTDGQKIRISSVITFLCHPGDLASPPVLVSSSLDKCTYQFMWRTAAACSLGVNTGEKCRVEDKNAGYVFDLNPLSQQRPWGKDYFKVNTSSGYFFQLTVCRGSNKCVTDNKNVGACRVKYDNSTHLVAGEANDILYYYDGMINLTYPDGQPCPENTKQNTMTHITFLCDASAPVNKLPEYEMVDSCTHNFRWRTKHACPAKVVECAVRSGEQQYDLSSLVKTADNWYTPVNGGTAYINICRTLNRNSKVRRCKGTPAVCLVPQDPSKDGINLGEVSSAPILSNITKEIMLFYTNGDICDKKKNARYRTQIHFSCKRGSADSSPKFEGVSECVYKFHWAVAAACAIENSEGENCMVTDRASKTTFNLMPLNTQFPNQDFVVNGTGGTRYHLRICGPLTQTCASDPSAAACEMKKNGETISLGVVSKKLHFEGEVIHLTYINGARDPITGRGRQVTIRFYCNPTVPLGWPKFVQQQQYEYVFDFQTSLACSAKAVQCSVTDNKGTKYDLTPLGLSSGNWEAVDTRPSQRHLHYFINVCRSVNTLPDGLTCAGGGIGGCQIDHKLNRGHNMGNVQSNPQVVGNGLLTLRYFGGEGCHSNKYQRSTRITFSCDKTMGSPIFVEESADCEYLFKWKTPFACPVKSHTGSHCTVEVPEYGYTFNLSSLNKAQNNYSVLTSDKKQKIILNVCGKLSTTDPKCLSPVNAGACLEGKKVLGVASEVLTYNGDITLRYSTAKPNCTVDIVFQCDTSQHGAGQGPELVTQIDNKTMCYYHLTWNTDLACIPLSHTQCSFRAEVSDGGSTYDLQYDLTSLSRKTGNWKAVNSADDARSVVYLINVCSSVNNEGEATNCNPAAGVCKVQTAANGKKRYWSLGVQRGSPKKVGNVIYLSYEGGDVDSRCTSTNMNASTRIQLSCSKTEGNPVYVTFYKYQCRYEFMWQTPAACPLNLHSGTVFNNCTALNLQQNYLFDLNPLRRAADYSVADKNQHHYFLNVCGPLSKVNQNKCKSKKTGICQLREDDATFHKNAGNYNKRLTFQDGVLALVYDGGEYCKHSHTNRTTVISFVCNGKAGSSLDRGTPVFVTESNDCTYYIDWHTSLACEKQIECLATDKKGMTFDLSALKKDDGNWPVVPQDLVGKPTAMYYINICRGLVPIPGIHCPAGSSACLVTTTGSVPVSMGRLDNEPKVTVGNEVILQYSGGAPCPEDPGQNISTKIIFRCAEGTLGKPMLGSHSGCVYTITWETSAACGHKQTADLKRCTVYDNATSHLYDLKTLTAHTDFKNFEAFSADNVKFLFNLCNGTSRNRTHGVCRVINETYCSGYGLLEKLSLYYSHAEKFLRMKYCYPDCDNYEKMAIVDFMCDIKAIPGNPKNQPIVASYSAHQVVITWNTSLACPPVQKSCIHSSGGFTYDLQLLSSQTRSWHYKTTDGQEFWINICRGINDGPEGCPSSASVCRQKDGKTDVLGFASTQRMTVSDNLLVIYSGQGLVKGCQTTPSVVFQFTCGSHIGRPELLSTIWSSCTFHFRWKTKAACKIERSKLRETNCKVTHPATNQLVDFSQLSDRIWKVISTDNTFYISTCGNIHTPNIQTDETMPIECQHKDNAVVCIKPVKAQDHPNAFKLKSRTLYYEDLVFSLWLKTESLTPRETSCPGAMFIINFYCSKGVGKGKPAFLYLSASCHYVFDWETSLVCVEDQSGSFVDIAAKTGALTSAGSKAGVAIAVIFAIAIVIIAVVVLRKKENREYILFYIRSRYRRLFMKRDFKSPSYRYTKVNTSDDEEADLLLNMDEQQQYVDDSDDDDILHL